MDANQPSAVKMLHHYSFMVKTDKTLPYSSVESPAEGVKAAGGRADALCSRGGRAVAIEFKAGYDSWDVRLWTEAQRGWALTYCLAAPFSTPYWVLLTLGTDQPQLTGDQYKPRRSWLVPFHAMLKAVERVSIYQNTLPYLASRGYGRAMQDRQIDAIHLFPEWELKWVSGGWTIPTDHLFYKLYISPVALPMLGVN